jgi:gluconolactonase
MVYDVDDHGDISNGRLFYDATEYAGEEPGLPDGMKVNSDGYLFATGPGGVWIFSPDARVLGKIKTGEFISNCAFGSNEEVLYMTADSFVLRLELKN